MPLKKKRKISFSLSENLKLRPRCFFPTTNQYKCGFSAAVLLLLFQVYVMVCGCVSSVVPQYKKWSVYPMPSLYFWMSFCLSSLSSTQYSLGMTKLDVIRHSGQDLQTKKDTSGRKSPRILQLVLLKINKTSVVCFLGLDHNISIRTQPVKQTPSIFNTTNFVL